MALVKKAPKGIDKRPNTYCPGCGHGIVVRLIAEVMEEKGLTNNSAAIFGVGCSCSFHSHYDLEKLQAAHGRAAAVARGMKRGLKDSFVYTYQGDGDAYVIGFSETMNAAYKNDKISTFVVNNNNFGMTGGQMSWTTLPEQVTTTSINGRDCSKTGFPINVPEIMATWNIAYAARGSVHNSKEVTKTKKYVRNAVEAQMNGEGFSIVEVLAPCPTNWKMSPKEAIEWIEKEAIKYYPLGEFKKRGVKE